jgi:voltage-gated potassium channel
MFKEFIKDGLSYLGDKISSIPYKDIARKIIRFIGDLLHRTLFTVLLPKKYRTLTKQQIYTIIFKSDTPAGKKFDIWLLILIGANIVTIMLESMAGTARWFSLLMRVLGWGFTILFTFEYYLRIYCLKRPWKYILSLFGIIDFLSIFPAYLSLLLPAASTLSVLRLMRVLRIFRIFKMQRFLDESRFLINALQRSAVKILIFMLFVFVMAIILGATMYGIEGKVNPAISTIPEGIYWAVVTITTVGYGDIAPVTHTGRFISLLVMLLGYAIIAVPTGIVAGETIVEHKQQRFHRHRSREQKTTTTAEPEKTTVATRSTEITGTTDTVGFSEEDYQPRPTRKTWDDDPGARIRPEDLL